MGRIPRKLAKKYWKARAEHHAQIFNDDALLTMFTDILFRSTKPPVALKRCARVYTSHGAYIIAPWYKEKEGYVGIKIQKWGKGNKEFKFKLEL